MELKTDNDLELVLLVQENNQDAKDYLYQKYSALIHSEINRFKKKALALDVDFSDLSQEAMLAFSHAINSFKDDSETKFITFATICIRRRLSNFIAKFETNKNKVFSTSIALDEVVEDGKAVLDLIEDENYTDPLRQIINSETLKEVNKMIGEILSTNEKKVLSYDLEGKNINEIAELMNMSSKQVYNLLHRARNKVKI